MREPLEEQAREQEVSPIGVIGKVLSFAETVRGHIDPMLDEQTNVKTCRTLTVGTAKLLESIDHHPVIKVKINIDGGVYHYWLEDPELGITIDYSPMSHLAVKGAAANITDSLLPKLDEKTLVLPLDSPQYREILGIGKVETRNRGKTSEEKGEQGVYTWDHIHLDKTPDAIKQQLAALK